MATISSPTIPGQILRTNPIPDPLIRAAVMSLNGATGAVDTRPTSGGALPGGYFRRTIAATPNTSSPMAMPLSGSGLLGIPVVPAGIYTPSIYARKSSGGPSARMACTWYNAAGGTISTTTPSVFAATTSWQRFEMPFTAPALAAFAMPIFQWSGTAVAAQTLDHGHAQWDEGSSATPYFDGSQADTLLVDYSWAGPVNASPSLERDIAIIMPELVLNYAYDRASRNVILEPIGSEYPTVFLRPAQSRTSTLSLLFTSTAAARAASDALGQAARFRFQEPAVGEDWEFIVMGSATVTKVEGINYWIVNVEVREVAAL